MATTGVVLVSPAAAMPFRCVRAITMLLPTSIGYTSVPSTVYPSGSDTLALCAPGTKSSASGVGQAGLLDALAFWSRIRFMFLCFGAPGMI